MKFKKLQKFEEWTGSQADLAETVSMLEKDSGAVKNRDISKRTINYYRSKGILDAAIGKKYGYLHILQCLLARKLSYEGWKIMQMAQTIPSLDNSQLLFYLEHSVSFEELFKHNTQSDFSSDNGNDKKANNNDLSVTTKLSLPKLAIHLLAQGIIEQYKLINKGNIVEGSRLPDTLKQAMGLLGRLCIQEGVEDHSASVHALLQRCTLPLSDAQWGLDVLADSHFPYRDVILIDPDHRCPTQECIELTIPSSEEDVREKYSFNNLWQICETFGGRRHEVYRLLRQYTATHLIVEQEEIITFLRTNNLTGADSFLRQECYKPLDDSYLIENQLFLCPHCHSPLKEVQYKLGVCTIRQCRSYYKHIALENGVEPNPSYLILRPHLRTFWFGPAIDELKVYQTCLDNNLEAELYPDSDRCDIAIDGKDIGIDVKSYSSPNLLGEKLTASIGGLEDYNRKIVAVSDSVTKHNPHYMETLKYSYKGKITIEFMKVSKLLKWLGDNS